MARKPITDLTQLVSPLPTDFMYVVANPATAALDRYAKLGDLGKPFVIDARYYGAKGDWNGSTGTDDAAAINAAITACAAARGGIVRLHGRHRITTPILPASNVIIDGLGGSNSYSSYGTEIYNDQTGAAFSITGNDKRWWGIRNLSITGNNSTSGHGIHINHTGGQNSSFFTIENVHAQYCNKGIYFESIQSWYGRILNTWSQYNRSSDFELTSINYLDFYNCFAGHGGANGWYFNGGNSFTLINCASDQHAAGMGFYLTSCKAATLIGCSCETNNGANKDNFYIYSSSPTLIGCLSDTPGRYGYNVDGTGANDSPTFINCAASNTPAGNPDLFVAATHVGEVQVIGGGLSANLNNRGSMLKDNVLRLPNSILTTIRKTSITDNIATPVFKITTTNESGDNDGGAYVCDMTVIVGHSVSSSSSNDAALKWRGSFTRAMKDTGTVGDITALEDTFTGAVVATSAVTRTIASVTPSIAENGEYEVDVSFQVDLGGNTVGTADITVFVELVFAGFKTAPVVTAL